MRAILLIVTLLLVGQESWGAPTQKGLQGQVDAGTRALEEGRFDEAIQLLQDAYDKLKDPDPVLLLNIGQAHRKAGHVKEAIDAFERYLLAQPDSAYKDKVQGYLTRLREQQQATTFTAAPPPKEAAPPAPPAALTPPPLAQPTVTSRPPAKPVYKRAWFWGVIGGVVAAGVVAGAVGGTLATHSDSAYHPPWMPIR